MPCPLCAKSGHCTTVLWLSRRRERLVVLHDVGGCESYLLVAGLTATMGRPGRHLIIIAGIVCAGRLAFYGELQGAFQNIGRLDSRMSVPRNHDSRIHFCINDYRHITRNWTVRLWQNLPPKAGRSCGRRTLRRCVSRNESPKSADCAGRKTRKSSPCQHGDLPAFSGSREPGLLETRIRIICRPYLGEQVG